MSSWHVFKNGVGIRMETDAASEAQPKRRRGRLPRPIRSRTIKKVFSRTKITLTSKISSVYIGVLYDASKYSASDINTTASNTKPFQALSRSPSKHVISSSTNMGSDRPQRSRAEL